MDGIAREERDRRKLPYLDGNQVINTWGSFNNMLVAESVEAVVTSTSEEATPDNIEILTTSAAAGLGIPVFVIEDFPGNYQPAPKEPLAGLFVEDDYMVEFHRSKGVDGTRIFNTGNPRYAELQKIDREREKVKTRAALGLSDEPTILWAGQPDGDNSYLTLERLLENYPENGPSILFRAHPRDRAYLAGKYVPLISSGPVKIIDVSRWPDSLALVCASYLVVTQFSSVAVEAGYLGVPALFVLFEDLGQRFFKHLKGYNRPPWCEDNCSFVIEQTEEITRVFDFAVHSQAARAEVMANFQRRFGHRKNSAKIIANHIKSVISESTKEVEKGQ